MHDHVYEKFPFKPVGKIIFPAIQILFLGHFYSRTIPLLMCPSAPSTSIHKSVLFMLRCSFPATVLCHKEDKTGKRQEDEKKVEIIRYFGFNV